MILVMINSALYSLIIGLYCGEDKKALTTLEFTVAAYTAGKKILFGYFARNVQI